MQPGPSKGRPVSSSMITSFGPSLLQMGGLSLGKFFLQLETQGDSGSISLSIISSLFRFLGPIIDCCFRI